MALNFGILQPVNIGGQIMAGQQEAQRNQLAQQQLRTGEMQQQKAELELADFKAKQQGLDKFLQMSAANGKTGSPEELASSFYDFAVSQRDPQLILTAQTLAQAAKERSAYLGSKQPTAAMPSVAPAPGALGSGTFDPNAAPVRAPTPITGTPLPANQLAPAAPVNQLGVDTTALESRINNLRTAYPNVPQAQKEADKLEKQLEEARKLYSVGGSLVTSTGKSIFTTPEKPPTQTELVRNYEYAKTPAGGNYRGSFAEFKAISTPKTSVSYGPQEKAFEGGLGKGQADRIINSQVAAQDAAAIIDTVKTGRDIMKSGMITGAGADFLVNLNQGLKTAGIDAGYADAAANSQAFTANMAGNVGKLIKQFGAGTGLSDADREFAKDMAGGRISLDAKAINRILDINERAARNVITRHNKDVKGIKTNIPLEVEMPPATSAAPAAPTVAPPPSAINYLRANPSMKDAFDAKYGAGAAARALKGQ